MLVGTLTTPPALDAAYLDDKKEERNDCEWAPAWLWDCSPPPERLHNLPRQGTNAVVRLRVGWSSVVRLPPPSAAAVG